MQNSMIINTIFSADMELGYGNDESRSMSPTSSPVLKNAPATCSTLMLWANHLKETSNKIDAGIMPPPATTLPLNIRRSSLTGLLSCASNDQSSPPMLKAEILDENSQNSILSTGAESLHDTIDYVSENSMDASNPATLMSSSPMDLMVANSFPAPPPLMTISSTSPINVVDLRVKQEDSMTAQIQDLVHPTLGEPPKLIPGVAVPDPSLLAPFGRTKLNDLKVQVNDVPMFNATTTTDVMLNNNLGSMNHVVVPPLTTNQQMQQTMEQQSNVFAQQGIMTEAGTANGLNHMLSFPSSTQAISPNILSTSPTNPLSTDVMLNSQSIPTINTSPNALLTVEPVNNPSIESDIIMNSTISPTMMCTNTSSDPATLLPSAVAIGDTPAMLAPPTTQQPTSEAILNNLIQPMSIKQSDAAVKNMILNAAAEILSSEPNSITPETATNALIEHVMNTEQTPQTTNASPPSITNILTHSDSTSSVVVLAGSNKLIQNGKKTVFF